MTNSVVNDTTTLKVIATYSDESSETDLFLNTAMEGRP